jgi:hypothetical protein
MLLRKQTRKLNAENEQLHATRRAKEEAEYYFEKLNYSRKGKDLNMEECKPMQ